MSEPTGTEATPEPTGYTAAVEELEDILDAIESDDVDVDVLADHVARATTLIEFCRSRILAAQQAVDRAAPLAGGADTDADTDADGLDT